VRGYSAITFQRILPFVDGRIYKIGEHLAKLQAKWLIVSHALFALHCPVTLFESH